jgi:hypothetical protein
MMQLNSLAAQMKVAGLSFVQPTHEYLVCSIEAVPLGIDHCFCAGIP